MARIQVNEEPCDCWNTMWSAIRNKCDRKKTGAMLRKQWGRLTNGMDSMYNRGAGFVRNKMERYRERQEGDGAHQPEEGSSSSFHRQDSLHQSMQEVITPVNYLAMCTNARTSDVSVAPLLPIWSIYGEEQLHAGKGGGGMALGDIPSLPDSFSVEELENYLVRSVHSTTLDIQLQSIPREEAGRSKTVGQKPSNVKKNRYKNNVPYNETRVVLQGDEQADYINASYIEGSNGPRDFIAAQGPKEANDRTIEDFWRMVWQEQCNVIVMLGNLIEGGLGKVGQYWPPNTGVKEQYGQVQVEHKIEKKYVDYTRRLLVVSVGSRSRDVVQYQYTGWPDHEVPSSPFGVATMIRDIARWKMTGPPVIHCSAGLGRTGTILLVLRLLDDLQKKGRFHPINTLCSMRKCRANLLDNQFQYRFVHHTLLELLFGEKTRFPLNRFSVYLNSVKQHLPDQYKKLKSFPINFTYEWAKSHNRNLNRNTSVLPPDGRHIPLPVNDHDNEYLNVVRVRGANLRDTYLVAEHPMVFTVSRSWKLAYMTKAAAWVFLHDHGANNEDFPSVLPASGYGELEGVTVEVTGTAEKQFFIEKSITVSQGEAHKMRLIQLKNWNPNSDLPSPPQSLIFLAKHIQEIRRAAPSRVILVSCSDGYSASGLFVALSRMVAEIDVTNHVDVYRTVQSVLFDRPQFMSTQRQYYYIHDAAHVCYKLDKIKQQNARQQANQTNALKTDEPERRRDNRSQLREMNERKHEHVVRERSNTEGSSGLQAARARVRASPTDNVRGKGSREHAGKENKGRTIYGVRQIDESRANKSGGHANPYSKIW